MTHPVQTGYLKPEPSQIGTGGAPLSQPAGPASSILTERGHGDARGSGGGLCGQKFCGQTFSTPRRFSSATISEPPLWLPRPPRRPRPPLPPGGAPSLSAPRGVAPPTPASAAWSSATSSSAANSEESSESSPWRRWWVPWYGRGCVGEREGGGKGGGVGAHWERCASGSHGLERCASDLYPAGGGRGRGEQEKEGGWVFVKSGEGGGGGGSL